MEGGSGACLRLLPDCSGSTEPSAALLRRKTTLLTECTFEGETNTHNKSKQSKKLTSRRPSLRASKQLSAARPPNVLWTFLHASIVSHLASYYPGWQAAAPGAERLGSRRSGARTPSRPARSWPSRTCTWTRPSSRASTSGPSTSSWPSVGTQSPHADSPAPLRRLVVWRSASRFRGKT